QLRRRRLGWSPRRLGRRPWWLGRRPSSLSSESVRMNKRPRSYRGRFVFCAGRFDTIPPRSVQPPFNRERSPCPSSAILREQVERLMKTSWKAVLTALVLVGGVTTISARANAQAYDNGYYDNGYSNPGYGDPYADPYADPNV